MTMSQNVPRKRYGLFILAVLVGLSGVAALLMGPKYSVIRALAGVAFAVGVYLVRISHIHDRSDLRDTGDRGTELRTTKNPGRLLWIVSLALLALLGASGFLLHIDAVNGGHEAWPADVFAGLVLPTLSYGVIWRLKSSAAGRVRIRRIEWLDDQIHV
jgi:hypothetical protein